MKNFIGLFLLLTFPLSAQHPPLPSPTPSEMPPGKLFKARAPEFARWAIVYQPGGGGAKKSGARQITRLQRVNVTKTKSIYLEQIVSASGESSEKWCVSDVQYLISAQGTMTTTDRAAFERGAAMDGGFTDYSQTDFPGWEWVSPKNFKKVIRFQGKDCILFEDRLSLLSDEEFQELQASTASLGDTRKLDRSEFEIDVRAMVDLETRLPLMLQWGEETRIYEFLPPTEGLLSPPAEVERDRLSRVRQRENIARRPARPY